MERSTTFYWKNSLLLWPISSQKTVSDYHFGVDPIKFHEKPPFSYSFPMVFGSVDHFLIVFLWFSYLFPWFSCFPIVFLCFLDLFESPKRHVPSRWRPPNLHGPVNKGDTRAGRFQQATNVLVRATHPLVMDIYIYTYIYIYMIYVNICNICIYL